MKLLTILIALPLVLSEKSLQADDSLDMDLIKIQSIDNEMNDLFIKYLPKYKFNGKAGNGLTKAYETVTQVYQNFDTFSDNNNLRINPTTEDNRRPLDFKDFSTVKFSQVFPKVFKSIGKVMNEISTDPRSPINEEELRKIDEKVETFRKCRQSVTSTNTKGPNADQLPDICFAVTLFLHKTDEMTDYFGRKMRETFTQEFQSKQQF